jgi:hypothetical protein
MKRALRTALLLAATLLGSAVAHAQTCPAGYPRSTPDSDFADAGSGTVRHIPTGLIWKRCAEGQDWNGSTCTGAAAGYTWEQAFARSTAVNAGTQGWNAGQTDWRVPNQKELRAIVERGCYNPSINATQFPATPASYFWSGSPNAGNSDYAWGVDFYGGLDYWYYRYGAFRVRLVRAGQSFYPFDAGVTHALTVTKSGAGGGTVSSSPAGIDCGATCAANFNGGASVTLTAAAATGSSFAGWSGAGCSGTGSCVVTMDAAKSVTASFTQNTYAVTASAGTGGTASCTPNPATHGGSSTCTATPNAGYSFAAWTGDCAGQGASCTLSSITATKSSAASFTQTTYAVTASTGTGGTAICTPNPAAHGGSSTCTATPNAGYSFAAWTGDCAGQGASCTLSNITATKSSAASFTQTTYAVTASTGTGGTAICTPNPAAHGGSATCTASSGAGYVFSAWTGDCAGQGASCTLSNITAAKSSSASFTQTTYAVTASTGTGGTAICTPNPAAHGGSATCTASPGAGYVFSAWTGDCAGQGASCTLSNITATKSSAASFTAASATQSNIPTRQTGVTATMGAAGCTGIGSATFIDAPAGAPGSFPFGLLDFTLTGCATGGTVTVTVTYSQALPAGAVFYKHQSGSYVTYPATLGANSVTFTLTDGGAGDADGAANGSIRDPGGIGVPGGGSVQSIPTLSEWGMIILSLLLAGMTARRLRRG